MSSVDSPLISVGSRKTSPDHPVRFSFVQHVFKAKLPKTPKPGDKPKHQLMVIVDKKSPDVARIRDAMRLAAKANPATAGVDFDTLDLILKDGDNPKENKKKRPELLGCYFFNATCDETHKPDVVGTKKVYDEAAGKERLERIGQKSGANPKGLGSGDYGVMTVNFYGYNYEGKLGIAAGLRNIQKLKDGPALGGSSDADDDFEAEADNDDFMK